MIMNRSKGILIKNPEQILIVHGQIRAQPIISWMLFLEQLVKILPQHDCVVARSRMRTNLSNKHLGDTCHDNQELTSWMRRKTDNGSTRFPIFLEFGQNVCPGNTRASRFNRNGKASRSFGGTACSICDMISDSFSDTG